jgi:4-hydroxy-tetrahydrodipicolinate reductase
MFKIGVFGSSGRMGKAVISEIKNDPSCSLNYSYSHSDNDSSNLLELFKSDVIIDFSTPQSSLHLIKHAINHKAMIVCGTTGFSKDEFNQIIEAGNSIPILYSANMSIGVNLIKYLLKNLVDKMPDNFDIDIIDIHHKHKKDNPSGTALMFKETLGLRNSNILSIRAGEIYGSHEIYFSGNDEQIKISHQAFSRKIFAIGALKAAHFLYKIQKVGLYNIDDVLQNL